MTDAFLTRVQKAYRQVQDEQVAALEAFDGRLDKVRDTWDRPEGGGGDTRILQNGRVIEKGGLNFSAVQGDVSPGLKQQMNTEAGRFAATGVSSVLHPHNPHVPIIHMNVRYFSLDDGTWWFGGGIDLTPHYVVSGEARAFHADLKAVCDRHAVADHPVTEDERRWQGLRRGRYVEFNLVHDRGTRFGLVSGGRTESILMSLPARAEWAYDHQPVEGSREAETLAILRRGEAGTDWLGKG